MAARKDLSKTYSEMDTEDLTAFESSEPTDMTLSPDDSEEIGTSHAERRSKVTRHLLERKQLAHDVQLLKIELSQKTLMIENLKAEQMQRSEELEERLADAVHQKQILQARLESQLNIQQDEARGRQENIRREMEMIMKRQKELEEANDILSEKAGNARRTLRGTLRISEAEYEELRNVEESELSLRNFVAIRIYEATRPYIADNDALKMQAKAYHDELERCSDELNQCQANLDEERRRHNDIQVEHRKITLELADTKGLVRHGEYRVENYDRVKSERDQLEEELRETRERYTYLEGSHQTVSRERDDLLREVASTKQTLSLLNHDKEFLNKTRNELQNKLMYSEERQQQLTSEIDHTKKAREDLYEKYVSSRDQYKSDYEQKLQDELEKIRVRTESEIDRLKTSTREMYERENRNLREAREMAQSERDRAQASEKDAVTKYEQLMNDFRQLQVSGDNKLSEMQNDLKIKSFELERTQMVYEETVRNLKECQQENEKLSKKLEVLTKEYYTIQNSTDRQVTDLEARLSETTAKLETYEKLEEELDDVVMQAAEIDDDTEAERVLFSYGYGANVPSTAKRRLKQSVQLARRVLQLERVNTSLKKEIDRSKVKTTQLGDELKNANTILDQAQQPYNYLIESIRVRDVQIEQQKRHIATIEEDIGRLEKENINLSRSKNELSADIERLLNQKEELGMMKQLMLNMSQSQSKSPREKSLTPRKSLDRPLTEYNKPAPTVYTNNKETSAWYRKMKQKDISEGNKYSKVYGISK